MIHIRNLILDVIIMKRPLDETAVLKEDGISDEHSLHRFFHKPAIWILFLCLALGAAAGAFLSVTLKLFQDKTVLPLLFSGIPIPEQGWFSCFSTLLLNTLICLILLFLFGVTAFGVFAVPGFLFLRGATIGIGAVSFLFQGGAWGMAECALIYTPAAALGAILLLLFGVRSLVFSDHLAKAGFKDAEHTLDFHCYFKDFLMFLCADVLISFLGSVPAFFWSVFSV